MYFGRDGTWVSVSGVLVKVVAITGAGRTINQQRPRGGAGALTETLHSAQDTHTHLLTGSPVASFQLFLITSVLLVYLVSSLSSFHLPFYSPLLSIFTSTFPVFCRFLLLSSPFLTSFLIVLISSPQTVNLLVRMS